MATGWCSGNPFLIISDRRYASLSAVCVIDKFESELAILDLIQIFIESVDRIFTNCREIDLKHDP
jgi:AP-3 complex subunit sigma